jgi:hypothetical protein
MAEEEGQDQDSGTDEDGILPPEVEPIETETVQEGEHPEAHFTSIETETVMRNLMVRDVTVDRDDNDNGENGDNAPEQAEPIETEVVEKGQDPPGEKR